MRSHPTLLLVIVLVAASLSVTACGLKDDLYLPEDTSTESPEENGDDDAADS